MVLIDRISRSFPHQARSIANQDGFGECLASLQQFHGLASLIDIFEVNIATDLSLRGRHCLATLLLVLRHSLLVHVGVPCGHHTIKEAKAAPARVIEEGLLTRVSKNAEARGEDGFWCTHVPHLVLGCEVEEEVTALVGHMQELIAGALDAVHLQRHNVLENSLHHVLLLRVRTKAQVRLEVAGSGRIFLLLKWRDIGRFRCHILSLAVFKVKQARLDGADVGSRLISSLV